jgi:hypothetical protein
MIKINKNIFKLSFLSSLADQFEMSLDELYIKVTNEHLPPSVRQILRNPTPGIRNLNPFSSTEWSQFANYREDQTETVKVNNQRSKPLKRVNVLPLF